MTALGATKDAFFLSSLEGLIYIVDKATWDIKRKLEGHHQPITNLTIGNEYFCSRAEDNSIYVWDSQSGALLDSLKDDSSPNYLSIEGNVLCSASRFSKSLKLWNLQNKTCRTFTGFCKEITSLHGKKDMFFVGTEDGLITIIDAKNFQKIQSIDTKPFNQKYAEITSFTSNDDYLFYANQLGQIGTLDLNTFKIILTNRFSANSIDAIYTEDNFIFFSADQKIYVFNKDFSLPITILDNAENKTGIQTLLMDQTQLLALSNDGKLKKWTWDI